MIDIKSKMSTDEVIGFVRSFKDDVLLPIARKGKLNEKICAKAVLLYADSLDLQSQKGDVVEVKQDGPYSFLHRLHAITFNVGEYEFGSIEHFLGWSSYNSSDSEFAEFIRSSKTPQMAHRRFASGDQEGKRKNFNYRDMLKENVKIAYTAMLKSQPELLVKLKSTGNKQISYVNKNMFEDDREENRFGNVLMELRKDL